MSSGCSSSGFICTASNIDTKILPRIGGSRRNAEIWKLRINNWSKKEGIITDEDKFS